MTNGDARRRLPSWIESFVKHNEALNVPKNFLLWAAIATVGAAMEQKVFISTSRRQLYPNTYTMLVGPPTVGKSVTIGAIAPFIRGLEGLHIGPISLTGASLVDAMAQAKRNIPVYQGFEKNTLEFNSLFLIPDDLQALLHEYSAELVGNMTVFFNTTPYSQARRVNKIEIEIQSPQLSILAGTTPSQLLKLLPPGAWEEGFMSRVIMVYSGKVPPPDDVFAEVATEGNEDLEHDLNAIFDLNGQMALSDEYREVFNTWHRGGYEPRPTHPKLEHYCGRRREQMWKLSMISCADRSDLLRVEPQDFNRALEWLTAAEKTMPYIFDTAISADAKVMQDLCHAFGVGEIFEKKMMRITSQHVSAHMVKRIIELMLDTGMIQVTSDDGKGVRYFRVVPHS